LFNEFLMRLKTRVATSSPLREFWQLARDAKVSLITQSEAPNVTAYALPGADEAAALYDVLDKDAMDVDETAAQKQREIEDDFDPFAEVAWNC
jgi:hypothetical protein